MYKKLQNLCSQKGTNISTLCREVTGSPGNLATWKKGYMRSDYLAKAADILDCTTDYLLDREQSNVTNTCITLSEQKLLNKYHNLDEHGKRIIDYCLNEEYDRCTVVQTEQCKPDIISIKLAHLPASAGTGVELSEENYRIINVKANALTKLTDFAVKVSGDSMEPTYYDGDILLVESMPYINVGDIGIFVVNGDGYVKEYGGDRLISHNPEYSDIKLSEHDVVMCSGKVIGVLEKDDFDI